MGRTVNTGRLSPEPIDANGSAGLIGRSATTDARTFDAVPEPLLVSVAGRVVKSTLHRTDRPSLHHRQSCTAKPATAAPAAIHAANASGMRGIYRFYLLAFALLFLLTACGSDPQYGAYKVNRFFGLLLLAVGAFFFGVSVGKRAHRAWRQR